ncbi:hypothetical protein BAC3_02512 [uncultured bacterium]|nr:hypothetical protein BAC3_02512 [uncultured bacterium]
MKNRIQLWFTVLLLLTVPHITFGQLSAPEVQDVYGGRINAMTIIPLSADSSLLYITTESANSAFYTTIVGSSATVRKFNVLPSMGIDDNLGAGIRVIASHAASRSLFFVNNEGLNRTDYLGATKTLVAAGHVGSIGIKGDYLFYTIANQLHFGVLDASGNFTSSAGSPLSVSGVMNPVIDFHPVSGIVYLASMAPSPAIVKSSSAYNAFGSATTFSVVASGGLPTSITWSAFGIAPDGRLLMGGSDVSSKRVYYSDDELSWTNSGLALGGTSGPNFAFSSVSASLYYVYFASAYSSSKGVTGTWNSLGNISQQTHPNDGAVCVDAVNPAIVYMTTDMGLGMSSDRGLNMAEINDGIEAVQVDDFDMNSTKTHAWLASKSGVRKVSDFLTTPVWSNAMFPNGDGSPYYSAEMDINNHSTAYAGNVRVYKTTDDGSTWNQKFTAENPPYNFNSGWVYVDAIEVCPYDNTIVFAGYFDQTAEEGGLFYSTDAGTNWSQIRMVALTDGRDVDVRDIVFNLESGDTVAYIGVSYDLSSPQGFSTYRLVKRGNTWTPSPNMTSAHTSTGTNWIVTINDLQVTASGDTILACGTDAGTNHPVAYYKIISGTNLWTPFTVSGFPMIAGKQGRAITIGNDTVYCAVDNSVYYIPSGGTSWSEGYTYPEGTRINVLYYDDLLVGTGTGLYGHRMNPTVGITEKGTHLIDGYSLSQNFPNPFNPSTIIEYSVQFDASVTVTMYSVTGESVATLLNQNVKAGSYKIEFKNNEHLPSGIYLYRISVVEAGSGKIFSETKKMILMK